MVIIIVIIGFITLHITPSVAVRTYIFTYGHPIVSITTTVRINEDETNMDKLMLTKENSSIYYIDGDVKDNIGVNIVNFKVKKIGFVYYAEPYGQL